MKVAFFSNFLNHHQLPFCNELIKLLGEENFHFVSSECIPAERIDMGYEDMNTKYSFVVRAYECKDQMDYALRLACDVDVAIIGSALSVFSEIRYRNNKLTFLFCERIFKNGTWHLFYPPTTKTIYNSYTRFRNRNFYILCASAYAADDMQKCFFPRKKCLRWGYFPSLLPPAKKQFDKFRFMWCGRMLWWKHPEDAIEVARLLNARGVDFELKLIGNGARRGHVESLIEKYTLQSKVFIYDFMSPSEIRKVMSESNVYLFTSGKQEGWGVVLNEAMNSGCVVIANRNAGSSPYLVEDGKSGILYDGSIGSLEKAIDKLLDLDLKEMSRAAVHSITEIWNPENAAKRLISFVENGNTPFEYGQCSLA